MHSIEQSESVFEPDSDYPLAEVIALPTANVGSFYQRRSMNLPRLSAYGVPPFSRAGLPSPVEAEPDTPFTRFKDFVRINRPAWLPQR